MFEANKVPWCHLRNNVKVDCLSMNTRFGTFSAPGERMWACGLVSPLLVAQTT